MTMRKLPESFSKVNLNFHVLGAHAQMIHRAAALRNETASAYMRRVLLEWAAADLGEQAVDLSEYAGDIIANAAKAVGLSTTEFTKRAAREAAARALGLLVKTDVGLATSLERTSAELGAAVGLPVRPPRTRISEPPASGSGEHKLAVGGRRR